MKRLLATLTLALLVSFAVGAGVAYAAGPGSDYARGTVNQGLQEWTFSASSNFNGTEPRGTVKFTRTDFDPDAVVTGRVTCLLVNGSTASIVAEVTDIRNGGGAFTGVRSMIISTTDSGKFPNNAPDLFNGFLSGAPATNVCPPPSPFQNPVLDGQVIVNDALT
jgi:hypothetical protein